MSPIPRSPGAVLSAVADVAPPGHPPARPRALAPGTPDHERLFAAYVRALRSAKAEADDWWNGILDTEADRVGDRAEAERNVQIRRPVGPASFPRVITTLRAFWLATVEVNRATPEPLRVAPEELLLGWLVDSGLHDLATFVCLLPFWPLGLDAEGNWV